MSLLFGLQPAHRSERDRICQQLRSENGVKFCRIDMHWCTLNQLKPATHIQWRTACYSTISMLHNRLRSPCNHCKKSPKCSSKPLKPWIRSFQEGGNGAPWGFCVHGFKYLNWLVTANPNSRIFAQLVVCSRMLTIIVFQCFLVFSAEFSTWSLDQLKANSIGIDKEARRKQQQKQVLTLKRNARPPRFQLTQHSNCSPASNQSQPQNIMKACMCMSFQCWTIPAAGVKEPRAGKTSNQRSQMRQRNQDNKIQSNYRGCIINYNISSTKKPQLEAAEAWTQNRKSHNEWEQ